MRMPVRGRQIWIAFFFWPLAISAQSSVDMKLLDGIRSEYPSGRRGQPPTFPGRERECRFDQLVDSVIIVADGPAYSRNALTTSSWRVPRFGSDTIEWGLTHYPSATRRGPDTVRAALRGLICPLGNPEILLERDGYYFGVDQTSLITVYGPGDPVEVAEPVVYAVTRSGDVSPLILHYPDFGKPGAVRITDRQTWQSARTSARRAAVSDRIARVRAKGWSAEITDLVIDRKLRVGMTAEMVRLSWGAPTTVNRTVTATRNEEQWVYGTGGYVYLSNGVVTAIQASR